MNNAAPEVNQSRTEGRTGRTAGESRPTARPARKKATLGKSPRAHLSFYQRPPLLLSIGEFAKTINMVGGSKRSSRHRILVLEAPQLCRRDAHFIF